MRAKVPMLDDAWNAIDEQAKSQAFTVSGVAQLDLVADVWRALDEALATGATLDDFQEAIEDELTSAWGESVANPGARIETIFRTNAQTAFNAGRVQLMSDPDVLADRPFWMFDAVMDSRTSDLCETCDETVRPADDPWWRQHTPPLHFNCRSSITSLTPEQAQKMGIDTHGPPAMPDQGFGRTPALAAWGPRPTDYPADLWQEYQEKNR